MLFFLTTTKHYFDLCHYNMQPDIGGDLKDGYLQRAGDARHSWHFSGFQEEETLTCRVSAAYSAWWCLQTRCISYILAYIPYIYHIHSLTELSHNPEVHSSPPFYIGGHKG